MDGEIGKGEDDPAGGGRGKAWSGETGLGVEMDTLAGTLLAIPTYTTDGWLPWVLVTVHGMVCSSSHSSLQPVVFGSSLPCLVLLSFSLSWMICSSGESEADVSKGLGEVDGALGSCHGVGVSPGELGVGVLPVSLTGIAGNR